MKSIEAYKILAEKFPDGFTWRDAEKTLNSTSGLVGNHINFMVRYGLIIAKGKPRIYYPTWFKCKSKCKVWLIVRKIINQLERNEKMALTC